MSAADFVGNEFGNIWGAMWDEIKKNKEKYDVPVKIAIVGFGNSGKSTLFNRIFGEDLQETGAQTDLTGNKREEVKFGSIFTDTPGFGTERFSVEEIKRMLHDQHLVIHCINGMSAIAEKDSDLYRFCKDSGKPIIVVVTKADVMKSKEIEQFRQSISEKISQSVDPIFISAETDLNMQVLIQRILDVLPEVAKDAFIAKQRVDFEIKSKKARKLIHGVATAAAAVAVSPIPVSDVIILIPMQAGMVASIGMLYGVKITPKSAKELLAVAGGGVVLRYAFQIFVKFLPGVGSFIGPVLAYGGTVAIGEAAILYFESGMKATPEEIAEAYKGAKKGAEQEFKSSGMGKRMEDNEGALKLLTQKLQSGEITQEEFQTQSRKILGPEII